MVITSLTNAKVAEVCRLYDKKYRKASGKYVIEGVRLVNDAIKRGAELTTVFVKESLSAKFDYPDEIVLADSVFAKISDTVKSQGVLAVVKKPAQSLHAPSGNCLILDSVQDPGNAGTLIRTAVACGFTDVYAVNSVDMYSPKVLRSAMSAHFGINIFECGELSEVLPILSGIQIAVADMDGVNAFEVESWKQTALIVGNEGNGVSDYARNNASLIVSLPMQSGLESLNVSVAGSVLMYQIYAKTDK